MVQGQRLKPAEWSEDDLLCSMSGHHAIALAALQDTATESDRAAEVSAQMRTGLQSLLGNMQVWHASVKALHAAQKALKLEHTAAFAFLVLHGLSH